MFKIDLSDLHLYQVVVSLISIFMIYQGIKDYFSGKASQTFLKVFARITVWGGMMLIAIFPKITNVLANLIGLKGNINAVILTGFILVFLIIFKLLSAIERLEQKLSELTRQEALKDLNKP